MTTDADYMADQIANQLVGGTITRALKSEPDSFGDASFGFTVSTPKGTFNVWVDCDAEGNGPGWLSIEGD